MSTSHTLPASRGGFLTRHPFKFLYVLTALTLQLPRVPLWILWFLPRGGRQHPQWSFRQALGMHILKTVLYYYSKVEAREPLNLRPTKADKGRFTVIGPASATNVYGHHPLNCSAQTQPEPIGASWFPAVPDATPAGPVILHFHGGAFVMGDARQADAESLATTLLRQTPASHVLLPAYRLAGAHVPACSFPAAVQDAVTSYWYVTRTLGVDPGRVVLSGDSAGGNLVLALLRYLALYGSQTGLAPPAAALLWSPWVFPGEALDETVIFRNRNEPTDYITPNFGAWGVRAYVGGSGIAPDDPWVSPLRGAFRAPTKLWVNYGGAEVLSQQIESFVQSMRDAGNEIEVSCDQTAPHDILLTGLIIGWAEEAKKSAATCGRWLQAQGIN